MYDTHLKQICVFELKKLFFFLTSLLRSYTRGTGWIHLCWLDLPHHYHQSVSVESVHP